MVRFKYSCFRLFDIIHGLIEDKETLQRITRELIEDFVQDGVIYAEIRTTPRALKCLTEREGIDAILDEIKATEQRFQDKIRVRLILSINRSEDM